MQLADTIIPKEAAYLLPAVFVLGTITLLGLCIISAIGLCWGLAYVLWMVLTYTSSTQLLLMGVVGYFLYRIGKGGLAWKRGLL